MSPPFSRQHAKSALDQQKHEVKNVPFRATSRVAVTMVRNEAREEAIDSKTDVSVTGRFLFAASLKVRLHEWQSLETAGQRHIKIH